WQAIDNISLPQKSYRNIVDVCLGVHNEPSAEYLKSYLTRFDEEDNRMRDYTRYAIRYGSLSSVKWALDFAETKYANKLVGQGIILKATLQAAQERGIKVTDDDRDAAARIVGNLLSAPGFDVVQVGAEL